MPTIPKLLFSSTLGQILFHIRQLGVVNRCHNIKNKITRKATLELDGHLDAFVTTHERRALHL